MLQPFRDAFSALGTEQIDRWALKEIFEALGNQITSEEEFEQQFQDIDTDGDGLITFEDFKRMITSINDTPTDADFYIVNDDDPSKPPALSADALSLLNSLFEGQKQLDGKIYILDLKKVQTQLQHQMEQSQKMFLPLEVFDIFFGTFLKKKSKITQQEFSDLISEAENRLFAIGDGAMVPDTEIQQPKAAVKLGTQQKAQETEQPQLAKRESAGLKGTEFAIRARQDSVRMIREEQTSLFAYIISELSAHTETPEVQLGEVVQILIEAGTFGDLKPKDWEVFFKVFSKKFDAVTERFEKLQNEQEDSNSKLQQAQDEKQDLATELAQLRHETQMALEQNEQLTQANNELTSYLVIFNETKASEARLRDYLTTAQNQMADIRAQLYTSQQNERELADGIQDYVDQINELRIELQSAKQIILQEGNENMRLRQESVRQSMMVQRQSMAQQPFASSALQGLRESTVAFGKRSQEETDLQAQSPDFNATYIKALQDAAKNQKLSEQERKGMLTIAQQFERYKKAYETVKREKDTLEEEQLKILKGVEKLDKQAEDRKRQNNKDRKEIEKLKTKLEQATQQKEELMQVINQLRVEIQMVNQGVIKKAPQAAVTVEVQEQPKSSMFVQKREVTNRSTDVAGILKRFGAKPVVAEEPEVHKGLTMEEDLQQEFDLPRVEDGSFFAERRAGPIVSRETQGIDGDFGSFINGIRDSRVSGFGFVMPQTGQSGNSDNNQDYIEFQERMSTWNAQSIQGIQQQAKPSLSSAQGISLPSKQAQRKVSIGRNTYFRPTMLNQVKESEEEEDGRSTVQNENGFELEHDYNENEETFENFDADERFSELERKSNMRVSQSTEQRFQSIALSKRDQTLTVRGESMAIPMQDQDQFKYMPQQVEMTENFDTDQRFSELDRKSNISVSEQMQQRSQSIAQSQKEQNQTVRGESMAIPSQDRDSSVAMPKQQDISVVHRDPSIVVKKQTKEEAVAELSVELQAAGDDQIKKLEVLLKHLENQTITKAEFIQKLTINIQDTSEPTAQKVEVKESERKASIPEIVEEIKDDFEVEIEQESSADDIIAVPADEEEFTPQVEDHADSFNRPEMSNMVEVREIELDANQVQQTQASELVQHSQVQVQLNTDQAAIEHKQPADSQRESLKETIVVTNPENFKTIANEKLKEKNPNKKDTNEPQLSQEPKQMIPSGINLSDNTESINVQAKEELLSQRLITVASNQRQQDHFLDLPDRTETEDGQTIVGKQDGKIGVDKQKDQASGVEEKRFSQGLKFGRKEAKTLESNHQDSRRDFYEENEFKIEQDDSDSDSDQFFMPNLNNRKTNQAVVSAQERDSLLMQQSYRVGDKPPKQSAWDRPHSQQPSAPKEVSHFSESEMQFSERDTEAKQAVIEEEDDSDDEEERNDQVQELGSGINTLKISESQLSDSMFDSHLPKIDQKERKGGLQIQDKIRMSVKDQFAVEQSVSKVQALLMRNSQVNRMSVRKSVINATSNQKDFDYLFLTKPTNDRMYKPILKLLSTYGESGNTTVFSEYIQSFNPELKVTEFILLINHKSLYLIDKKGVSKGRHDLLKLRQIIMIKTNPCIFALSFGGMGHPLLLQSFRRSELIMFLLSQCKNNVPKVNVTRSKGVRIFLQDKFSKNKIEKVIKFDKISSKENSQMSKDLIKQLEKNVQLNNFANAINSGYLKMRTNAFLIGTRWEERFVVLTNVGLLYFADPHQAPLDLFPVLDCEIEKVPASEVKGNECTFKLVYLTKHVTFQCSNAAEFANWLLQIQKLQKVTMEVRDRLKQEEVRRMTMLMGQL